MRQERWGREKERERKRERETGESRGEMYVGPSNRIPIRPLKLITSTTCVYFLLVLLPVRSSLSFNSHTSPFLCTLPNEYITFIYAASFVMKKRKDMVIFIALMYIWLSSFTPTISNMGLNILDHEGGLVPSVQWFSPERHIWWCGLVFTCVSGRSGWDAQNLVLWCEQLYIA